MHSSQKKNNGIVSETMLLSYQLAFRELCSLLQETNSNIDQAGLIERYRKDLSATLNEMLDLYTQTKNQDLLHCIIEHLEFRVLILSMNGSNNTKAIHQLQEKIAEYKYQIKNL